MINRLSLIAEPPAPTPKCKQLAYLYLATLLLHLSSLEWGRRDRGSLHSTWLACNS